MQSIYYVTAIYDDLTNRWTAISDDIPGLVCEEKTYKELKNTVAELAPQLVMLNSPDEYSGPLHISMTTQSAVLAELPVAAE
jgi:hypothetical protein